MARLGVRREPTAPSFHVASRRLPLCVGPAEHSPMVVPHLPVIRAAAPPGILNAPLPTAAPGLHSAPGTSPHPHILPRPLSTATPGPGPPSLVSPLFAFLPRGTRPRPLSTATTGPSPQSPSQASHFWPGDWAPAPPHSCPGTEPPVPIFAFLPRGLGPHPSPQLPRDRALRLTCPLSRSLRFTGQLKVSPNPSLPANTINTIMVGMHDGYFPIPFLQVFVRSRARASQCRVLSSGAHLLLG
jgi:hypothetical protein